MVSASQVTLVVGAGPSRTGWSSGFTGLARSTVLQGRSAQVLVRYLLVCVHSRRARVRQKGWTCLWTSCC